MHLLSARLDDALQLFAYNGGLRSWSDYFAVGDAGRDLAEYLPVDSPFGHDVARQCLEQLSESDKL